MSEIKTSMRLVRRELLAHVLGGIDVRTIDQLRKDGMPGIPVGPRTVLYDPDEVIDWLRNRRDGKSDAA